MGEKNRTYFALSSPPGNSATSNIRISGPQSLESLSKLTKIKPDKFLHRKTVVCNIYNKNNILIDKAVVVYYQAPNSYTGEDVAEIHPHGNPLIVEIIFEELIGFGLVIAEPGEFTRNAYLNDKIDLIQAEAVFSLISAKTNRGVALSINNASGALSSQLRKLRLSLIDALSHVEYELDISEMDSHTETISTVSEEIRKNKKTIKKLIKSYKASRFLQAGIKIVIVGAPNVGKSTLFNALLNQDRAIVSKQPGTTRDLIDGTSQIANYSVRFVDTAGIRKTKKTIEKEGIKRTKTEIEEADLIYHILDPTIKTTAKMVSTTTETITIYNKLDLLTEHKKRSLIKKNAGAIFLSAKFGTGIGALKRKTKKTIEANTTQKESIYLTSKRQQTILLNALVALRKASKNETKTRLELISVHLREAIEQFDWLVGKTTPDDVLNTIFSQFCVGK